MKANIAILNYNGKELLKECLPSVVEAAKNGCFDVSVTVLDNCSNDGSIDLLKNEFPTVNIHIAKENKVYCSYNDFFQSIADDVVIILNSDIKVDKNFLNPLIEHFIKDPQVFFVSSRMYYFDGFTYQGDRAKAVNRFGVIGADTRFKDYETLIEKKGYTFSTGNGAFDRKKFLELGGFDELYLPGRYEDVDFCFRGWKAGYKGMYEPQSIIYHKGYASFKDFFSNHEIAAMVFRNSLFFMLKNISNIRLKLQLYLWLPIRLLFFLLTGRIYFIKAFWEAMKRLPEVKEKRKQVLKTFRLTDKEVLSLVG